MRRPTAKITVWTTMPPMANVVMSLSYNFSSMHMKNIKVDFYPEGTKSNVFVRWKKKSFYIVRMG
jgi:hypothetical protein